MADFKLKGVKAMERKMERIAQQTGDRIGAALYLEGERIMTRSKRDFVPVDLSPLKNSGHTQKPVRKGKNVEVTLAFGGPSAPYAVVQHERLDFKHTVGQAKYLERPLMEAVPGMDARIAKELKL